MNKLEDTNSRTNSSTEDDEIRISELVDNLARWVKERYRALRLIAISLIFLVIFGSAGSILLNPPMMTYSIILSLTFPQAEKDRYPNESPFGITDIVTRSVLEEVWRQNAPLAG